jgi:hypothetical protein
MKLYIANVTKQEHVFVYNMGEDYEKGKRIELAIPAGHQIFLDDEQVMLEKIVKRYRRYGMIEVKEFDRGQKFSGLMFQWEKEINLDKLKAAVERRHEVEDSRANDMRMVGILGDQSAADRIARQTGLQGIKVTSEIEERTSKENNSRGVRPIRQKLTVDTEGGDRRRA